MMTNPQAKIATTTITRSSVDITDPRVCLMTSAIGVPEAARATGSPAARVTAIRNTNPNTPEARTA